MEVETAYRSMPGSFGDEDVPESYHGPYKSAQTTQDKSQNKIQASATASWSAENSFDIDLGDIDWHKYEPPSALHKAPNVTSVILLDILTQSITNVTSRVAEEDLARQIEDEQRRVAEEEATKNGKSPEPYLPIVIPAERPLEPDISSINNMYSGAGITSTPVTIASTSGNFAAVPIMRDSGRKRDAFWRFVQRAPEYGESSSAGGVREALWRKLEARLSKVNIATTGPTTQEALMAFRKSGFIVDGEPPKPDPEVYVFLFFFLPQ